MKQENKTMHQRFGLAVLFSAIVFVILLITSVLIFIVGILLIRINAINIAKLSHQEPMLPVFMLLILSVVVGTVVSFMISRFPLKPLRRVIDAHEPPRERGFLRAPATAKREITDGALHELQPHGGGAWQHRDAPRGLRR